MKPRKSTIKLPAVFITLSLFLLTGCGDKQTPVSSSGSSTQSVKETSKTEAVQQSGSEAEELYYNKTDLPICNTPIQLTAAVSVGTGKNAAAASKADKSNINQLKHYFDLYGLDITVDNYTSDSWSTQVTTMIATDQLPDMLFNSPLKIAEANKYGKEGYFVNLNQYSELLPNFQEMCKLYPDLDAVSKTEEGECYTVPFYAERTLVDLSGRFFLNKKWIDNLNLTVPKTLNEFYDLMLTFKNQDANGNGDPNDEIPLSYDESIRSFTDRLLFTAFGINSTQNNFPLHVNAEGKVVLLDDNLKAYASFLTKLFEEGLMDKNSFVLSGDEANAQIKNDMVGCYPAWAPYVSYGSTAATDKDHAYGLTTLSSEYTNNKNNVLLASPIQDKAKFLISTKCQYIEACVRLLDALYTPEGSLLSHYGLVGDEAELQYDEALNVKIPMVKRDARPSQYENENEWRYSEIVLNETLRLGAYYDPNPTFVSRYRAIQDNVDIRNQDPDKWNKAKETYGWPVLLVENMADANATMVDAYPTLPYPETDSERRNQLITDLTNTYKEAKASIIIDGQANFEANFEKLRKDLDSMNLSELLEIEQKAYDAFMARMK